MQPALNPDYLLDQMPFFGDEDMAVPDLPLPRTEITLPIVHVAAEPAPAYKALRIVRAKTGETEMRLLAKEVEGKATAYVVRSSTLHPYKHEDNVLKKGESMMNETQARKAFERLVTTRYPAIALRESVVVPVHLDLL